MRLERWCATERAEEVMEYEKWADEIPFIPFRDGWEVQVCPPWGGAVVRFLVKYKVRENEKIVSVFLDCYDMLGSMHAPYWEINPSRDGFPVRYAMNDIDGLIAGIDGAFAGLYYERDEDDE